MALFHHGWGNFEYCTSQMPKNVSWGENCYIFKFQICLPPKLNLPISFPSQKLSIVLLLALLKPEIFLPDQAARAITWSTIARLLAVNRAKNQGKKV